MNSATMQSTANRLASFIREHGHPCRVQADGTIRAAVAFGSLTYKGFRFEVETVQPNMSAVREFLGY